MHESPQELAALQSLLDESMEEAGPHLSSVITSERRLTAAEVCDRLVGMRLLALATVTADGRPLVGPVDGIFYRGRFYFGSSPDSVRFRHIGRRADVSATHLPGEELAVTVHGRAGSHRCRCGGPCWVSPGTPRHLRAPLRPAMGAVPRLRVGVRADRPGQDVHLPHGSG